MKKWIKDILILALLLVLGIGGGYSVQAWRQGDASAPKVVQIDLATPGLPGDQVVLVSLSTCPACAAARNWLTARQQPFREMAVDKSDGARALADRLGFSSVPVLLVGNQAITGFDADTFERTLANAKLTH